MRETVNIACSPLGEDCVQVSPASDYTPMMNKEVNAFKRMLERMTAAGKYGDVGKAFFKITTSQHDFGSYKEVEVSYDESDEVGCDFAYIVEGNIPEKWDDEARAELGEEYFAFVANQNKK